MNLKLTDIALQSEIDAVPNHPDYGDARFIRDEGEHAVYACGHYTEAELLFLLDQVRLANKFWLSPAKWHLKSQLVRAVRAFKQNPTPPMSTVIRQIEKELAKCAP